MNRTTRRAFLAAAMIWVLLPADVQAASRQDLLARAKATLASEIEPGLPATPLEIWLRALLEAPTAISWSLNDCGEQTGSPEIDAERDLALCAELEAPLTGGRSIYLYFLVATETRGVVERPALYFAGVLDGENVVSFATLSALVSWLRENRR